MDRKPPTGALAFHREHRVQTRMPRAQISFDRAFRTSRQLNGPSRGHENPQSNTQCEAVHVSGASQLEARDESRVACCSPKSRPPGAATTASPLEREPGTAPYTFFLVLCGPQAPRFAHPNYASRKVASW